MERERHVPGCGEALDGVVRADPGDEALEHAGHAAPRGLEGFSRNRRRAGGVRRPPRSRGGSGPGLLISLQVGDGGPGSRAQGRERGLAGLAPRPGPGEALQHLGVSDVSGPLAAQQALEVGCDDRTLVRGDLDRVAADVGRRDDVLERQQRMVVAGRLEGEGVEGRSAQGAALERGLQRPLVDQRCARRVDQERAGLHPGELRGTDQHACRVGHGGVQAHDVALAQQRLERHEEGSGPRGLLGVHEGVGHQDSRAEGLQPGGDLASDGAEPDEPHGLAPQLAALKGGEGLSQLRHVAGRHVGPVQELGGRSELAHQHQREGECQVRDGIGVAPRRVEHRNAEGGARFEIDVHRVAAARSHDAQRRQACQGRGIDDVDLGDEHLAVAERFHQGIAREQSHRLAKARVLHVAERCELRKARVVHRRGDEYARRAGLRRRIRHVGARDEERCGTPRRLRVGRAAGFAPAVPRLP
jgi:hypothetical protein